MLGFSSSSWALWVVMLLSVRAVSTAQARRMRHSATAIRWTRWSSRTVVGWRESAGPSAELDQNRIECRSELHSRDTESWACDEIRALANPPS